MLKKLSLDQTKKYEQAIATFEIAKMVVDFIKGRKHYLSIGAEQGDIKKWDDIIIEELHNYIHIQVKRQRENFGSNLDECKRNKYNQGRINEYRDLSELDNTMKSLADWSFNIDPVNLNHRREFWFELPEANTYIKKDLQIKHLKDLCDIHIKPAVTTSQGLENLALNDSNIKNCYDWLTTWCDFKDWNHILKALQLLKIKNSGTEPEIIEKTEQLLKEVFTSDKAQDARLKILAYTVENESFTGAIKPRNLLFELKKYLHQDIPTWTQFEKINYNWNVTGIHDLEFNTEVERPTSVVPLLWKNDAVRHLKINAPSNSCCKLSDSLIRLSIHQTGSLQTQYSNLSDWKANIKNKTGGTLGIGEEDIDQLTIVEDRDIYTSLDGKPLINISDQEVFASELEDKMLEVTWNLLKNSIENKILCMDTTHSSELRDAVDKRWNIWKPILDISPTEQNKLFKNMLHPYAEGDDISSSLRIGVKTVNLLTNALLMVIMVSVCLDEDNNGDWKKISESLSLNAIGLQYWSGIAGKPRNVRKISNDVLKIIGQEKTDILIMSDVESSPSDILDLTLADTIENTNTLASGKQLKLLVTDNIYLRHIIEKGDILALRSHLTSLIAKNQESKRKAIVTVIS